MSAVQSPNLITAVEDFLDLIDTAGSPYTIEVLGDDGLPVVAALPEETEQAIERIYTALYGTNDSGNNDIDD